MEMHRIRCRHHTDHEGLDGIEKTREIWASRGPALGVDVEVEPFGPVNPYSRGAVPRPRPGREAEVLMSSSTYQPTRSLSLGSDRGTALESRREVHRYLSRA